jgi:formiminotetrahydrofolate cyclodeaminase
MSVRDFCSQTAAKSPTPGGGSVAGVIGALGVALGEMSLNFTKGKKKFAEHEAYYAELTPRLENARKTFEQLVAEDVAAYEMYQAANKMSDDDPGKVEANSKALEAAISVPRKAMELSLQLLEDLRAFEDKCNTWLISDLVASAALAVATVHLSDYNVRINARVMDDEQAASQLRETSATDRRRAESLLDEIETAAANLL